MSVGDQVPDDVLERRICQLAPNKCCTLIYTVLHTPGPLFYNVVLAVQMSLVRVAALLPSD